MHAKVISPEFVTIHDYEVARQVPKFSDPEELVVLVYPDNDACNFGKVREISKKFKKTRALFIDGTWKQSRKIRRDLEKSNLLCVKLDDVKTLYWRNQNGYQNDGLATIEVMTNELGIYTSENEIFIVSPFFL